ncbi:DUF1109 domain-containing protein [Sphingomonas sp.]|uniref:DUF1109 domain-containing protein n=1 Tax=Sphingomonas sp. TaxID=28214 RepID=UPI001D43AF13|nr:DUF1109 domain-containing protein [Sphingomonas sp.]MBX9796576.1 DUF1109 domain-containing protein [Sphingomonas sp.]
MRTDDLIAALADDTRPVRRHAVEMRILTGLAMGAAITAVAVLIIGLRPDMSSAMMTRSFLMKWSYTITLALVGVAAMVQAARPDRAPRALWFAVVPVALMAAGAGYELATTPVSQWENMMMGHSAMTCPVTVGLLSIPILAGLLWSFRALAPVRLRVTGAALGLAAGAAAATLYGLSCDEHTAIFTLTWYSLGIGLAMLAGALVGPRLLRW